MNLEIESELIADILIKRLNEQRATENEPELTIPEVDFIGTMTYAVLEVYQKVQEEKMEY